MSQFTLGFDRETRIFSIFECISDEETILVCTASELEYAEFIVNSLNHCKDFSPTGRTDMEPEMFN